MGTKTRNMMRSDLRLDLKDSGALWSNAELDRCLERAHSDFNRFLPREKYYEETLSFSVSAESITSLAAQSLIAIVNAQSIDVAAGNFLTIAGQPDLPRPLTLTITDANNSTYGATFIVAGMDKNEVAQTEVFHYSRGHSKTLVGKKEFKYVYTVELESDSGSGAGDTLSVGYAGTTTGWVYLAYKPIKYHSDTITSSPAGTTYARDTDYTIDYINGRIKLISGGSMAAATAYLVTYTKDQLAVDLSDIADLIRVERVEYPVGQIPQSFVGSYEQRGKLLYILGGSEGSEQESMSEDYHIRIYYAAEHQPPNDDTPGSMPDFLENTVIKYAGGEALFIYSLKCEHQALTDLTTARTAIAAAESAQAGLAAILTAISAATDAGSTALGLIAALQAAAVTAVDAANTYLDAVAGDLTSADGARANYMGTTNYVDGGTEPDIKAYLTSGDALLNTVTKGGENEKTAESYAAYAQATKNSLVAAHEQDRAFYQQDATARTNAALGFVQEAAQRVSIMRNLVDEGSIYAQLGQVLVGKANALLSQIASYLQEAAASIELANNDLTLADKFRTEAIERRNEVWNIWRDRKEYIGDFTASSMNQGVQP